MGILQLIETAGHPGSISPTRLADRYDVEFEDEDTAGAVLNETPSWTTVRDVGS